MRRLLSGQARLRRPHGFTLIELMVTLAIFTILTLLAMPSFNTWIANNRVRAVAEDMANGLRLAQTEALRRSRQTVFALTGPNPGADPTGAPNYSALANGSTWAVSAAPSAIVIDGVSEAKGLFVRGGAIADIGSGVTVTGPTVVCFGPQGLLVENADVDTGVGAACDPLPGDPPAYIYKIKSASAAGDHPLQIEVGLGGQVRLCDPAQALGGNTPGASEGCQYPASS